MIFVEERNNAIDPCGPSDDHGSSATKQLESSGVESRSYSVVVVEDSPADVRLFTEALSFAGVRTKLHLFDNGHRARRAFREWSILQPELPDLIVLDINLPGINGLDLLQVVRSLPSFDDVKVVMLTSSSEPADRARAGELGANAYIVKPFDFKQIVEAGKAFKALLE